MLSVSGLQIDALQEQTAEGHRDLRFNAPFQCFVAFQGPNPLPAAQARMSRMAQTQVHPDIVRPKLLAINVDLVDEQEKIAINRLEQLLMAALGAIPGQTFG